MHERSDSDRIANIEDELGIPTAYYGVLKPSKRLDTIERAQAVLRERLDRLEQHLGLPPIPEDDDDALRP